MTSDPSPADSGYAMPAEWAPQAATWLSWPLNPATWPGRLERIQGFFARLAAVLARYQEVRINATGTAHPAIRSAILAAGAPPERIVLFDHPTNDVWCRDHGPTFVTRKGDGSRAIVHWRYNAWGGKYPPWDADADVPRRIAGALGLPRFESSLVFEGGGLEVDGEGTVLTTDSVLLNPNRNPGLSREAIEAELRRMLGVSQVGWLPSGLEGDDTDGHIDTLSRFFPGGGIVTAVETDRSDPNHAVLDRNRALLAGMRSAAGRPYAIVDLPQPAPIRVEGWRCDRLPGTYANFLIVNGGVIVPTYRQPEADDRALGILRECFPGRRVEGFDSLEILLEGGAIHCLTQQEPA